MSLVLQRCVCGGSPRLRGTNGVHEVMPHRSGDAVCAGSGRRVKVHETSHGILPTVDGPVAVTVALIALVPQ